MEARRKVLHSRRRDQFSLKLMLFNFWFKKYYRSAYFGIYEIRNYGIRINMQRSFSACLQYVLSIIGTLILLHKIPHSKTIKKARIDSESVLETNDIFH